MSSGYGVDRVGFRSGRLVVVSPRESDGKPGGKRWLCRCDCGSETVVRWSDLRSGNTRSCGCLKKIAQSKRVKDEVGNRFGKLVVLSRHGTHNGFALWRCVCDCGNETISSGNNLRNGISGSCGCSRVKVKRVDMFWKKTIDKYKRNAESRSLEFRLTDEQAMEMMQKDCFYCGASPKESVEVSGDRSVTSIRNGIDRVDSSRGYEMTNVVPCCAECNRAKGASPAESFVARCARIASNLSDQFKAA